LVIDPTTLTDGQQFKVRGERGVFAFRGIDADGSIRCYGGATGRGLWRNFNAEQLSKVIKNKQQRDK
jgi:hypothetical protein